MGDTDAHLAILNNFPTGLILEAILSGRVADNSTTGGALYISSPAQADAAATATNYTSQVQVIGTNNAFAGFRVMTDTSARVRLRAGAATVGVVVNVNGWIDRRGRDA